MIEGLRILVVDDGDRKRAAISATLSSRLLAYTPELAEASSYEEALEALRSGFFDIVILDLLLPAAGAPPSLDTSRTLIQMIAGGQLTQPTHLIGLTAFPEVKASERTFYESHLFALEHYDEVNMSWADRIVRKIEYLVRSKNAALRLRMESFDFDVVVLTARHENEYVPVRKRLFRTIEQSRHPMWPGEIAIGWLPGPEGRRLRTALVCVGEMGMAPTAVVATQVLTVLRPRLIAMLGMCCGFGASSSASPQKFMDAIVVRQVSCWEEGRYIEEEDAPEFRNRSKPRFIDDAIRQAVEETVERSAERIAPALKRLVNSKAFADLRARLPKDRIGDVPAVRFTSIVSGSSVVADEKQILEILRRHPAAVGLDMEVFGLYTAADLVMGRRSSVLAVKGVADFGDAKKDDAVQKAASIVSAEVFKALLPGLPVL